MSEDTKMLTSVAVVVVLGAVGLALVASCNAEPTSRENSPVQPASRTVDLTPPPGPYVQPEALPEPVIVEETAAVGEVPFEVGADEDFVARGLETWNAGTGSWQSR